MTDATRDRFELQQALGEILDEHKAATLMTYLNDHPRTDLATRDDVRVLTAEVRGELRDEIADLKNDLAGVKKDVAGVRNELADVKKDVAGVRGELAEVKSAVGDLKGWTVSVILAGNSALVAAVVGVMSVMG